jgi:Caspase domain
VPLTPADRSRSRAILMGTSEYTHMTQVPAALHSLNRIKAVLTSELCVWPADRVSVFANERRPGDLPQQLVELFGAAEDIALFYYVGHGQADPLDMLCLGLTGSRPEPATQLRTTSLPFDAVRYALAMSPAKAKIVILDCCFAGLAAPGRLSAGDVLSLTRATGAYTIAAAGEFEKAWFETNPDAPAPQTYFTKYFLDVIERGIPGEGPELRLEPIFNQTAHALAHDSKPVPTSTASGTAPFIVFARNAAQEPTSGDPGLASISLPDYASSCAILIGVGAYADKRYSPIPEATHGLREFAALLGEQLCCWPSDRVIVFEDPADAARVLQQIRRAAREASDVVFLYFAGHATVTDAGHLALALSDTDSDDADITGIEYERIRDALRMSRARTKVVILDCDSADRATADGTSYLLTAPGGSFPDTPIAGELVQVIRTGIPGGPPLLTLPRVYADLRRRLADRDIPVPRQRSSDEADQVAFARNAASGAAWATVGQSPVRPDRAAALPPSDTLTPAAEGAALPDKEKEEQKEETAPDLSPDAPPVQIGATYAETVVVPWARIDHRLLLAGSLAIAGAVLAVVGLFPAYMSGAVLTACSEANYPCASVSHSVSFMTPGWSSFLVGTAALFLTAGVCTFIPRAGSLLGPGLLLATVAASTTALAYNLSHLRHALSGNVFGDGAPMEVVDGFWLQLASNVSLILAACLAGLALGRVNRVHLLQRPPRDVLPWLVVLLGAASALALVFQDQHLATVGGPQWDTVEVPSIAVTVLALAMPAWAAAAVPRRLGAALLVGWIWVGAAFSVFCGLFFGSVQGSLGPINGFVFALLALSAVAVPFAKGRVMASKQGAFGSGLRRALRGQWLRSRKR